MIDLEILKEQNKLTINDNGLIYIKPIGDGWQTYPLDTLDDCLLLTPEEYVLLKARYYKIKDDHSGLEIYVPEECSSAAMLEATSDLTEEEQE